MAKYRKKPVVIEAVQWQGWNTAEIADFVGFSPAFNSDGKGAEWFIIPTLEGDHRADRGDFIIKGVQGEFYPCKPGIFAATYEAVEEG